MDLISEIRKVWGVRVDRLSDWIHTMWLVKKQLDELQEKKYDGMQYLKESADILIILIKYLDKIGIDYEELCLWRLKMRHAGSTKEICAKYREMYEEEVIQK